MKFKTEPAPQKAGTTRKLNGFTIALTDGHLGYDGYSYFTEDRECAEVILDDVREEFPDLRIVPAVLEYQY